MQRGDLLRDAAAAYESGDTNTAVKLYREFLKDHSDAAEIRSNLAAALVRAGQFAEAIEEYKAALAQIPNNPRVRMNLALAYYKIGRIPDAAQELQALHELQPAELQPALLLADCLLQTGETDQAAKLLAAFEPDYPEDRALAYLLGVALLKQNQMEPAQKVLDKILRGGESAEAAYLLGQAAHAGQNHIAAAQHLERAIQLNPNLPGVHSLYGTVLRDVGKADLAPQQYAEELKRNPYDFVANIETAMLLKQDRKFDAAMAHIEKALQVRPNDAGALYQRASIHSLTGRNEQARKELEELVRRHSNFSEARMALATVYYRLNRKADGDRERAAAAKARENARTRK